FFDNAEFEERDLTPEEWVRNGSHAVMPFYHGGEWRWANCTVLGYDAASGRFSVRRRSDGSVKEVRRFHLLFDAESRVQWERRRAAAGAAREEAKRRLRLDHYISRQPMEAVRPVQAATLRGMHERVADGLPLDVSFPGLAAPLAPLLRELTREVIRGHARCMKKAILFHKV
ncbi:unnamed protein product, partial [Phaeothamnion confervicola]